MYQEHFGLRTDPFPLYPSLKFVFLSTAFEEAMAHLAYGLEHEEDVILITGPIGTGKTLAVQSLLSNLSKLYRTAFVNVTQLDYPEVLKLILADLGAPVTRPADRGDLLGALKEQVRLSRAGGHKILIIVDEAQNLSPATLEGLRLLTNLGQPEGQAVQLVLVGQPDLEKTIRMPQLVQLRQRIRVHYRLETLNRPETEAYIAHRLKVAGAERTLFTAPAIDLIYRASSGVPRLVNILCSSALLSAFVAGAREVDVSHVDLEELPPASGVEASSAEAPTMQVPAAPAAAPAAAARPSVAHPAAAHPAAARPAERAAPESRPPQPVAPPAAPPAAPAAAPTASPAPAPRVGPGATAPLAEDLPPTATARPVPGRVQPTAAFRRRNRRGLTWFLLALLALALGAAAVFSLRPAWPRRSPAPPAETARGAQPPPVPVRDEARSAPSQAPSSGESPAAVPATGPPGAQADTPADGPAGDPAAEAAVANRWAVHVHSFQGAESASRDIAKFNAAGFPAFYRSVLVEGQQWERVYVGPYETMAAAQAAEERLRRSGITTYALIVKLGDGS